MSPQFRQQHAQQCDGAPSAGLVSLSRMPPRYGLALATTDNRPASTSTERQRKAQISPRRNPHKTPKRIGMGSASTATQSTIPKLVRRTPLTQEVKKFDAFAQASLHHLRATYHFADNRGNFAGAKIEAPIEMLDRSEDFGVAQMR